MKLIKFSQSAKTFQKSVLILFKYTCKGEEEGIVYVLFPLQRSKREAEILINEWVSRLRSDFL
jgi:hypothetical protein